MMVVCDCDHTFVKHLCFDHIVEMRNGYDRMFAVLVLIIMVCGVCVLTILLVKLRVLSIWLLIHCKFLLLLFTFAYRRIRDE